MMRARRARRHFPVRGPSLFGLLNLNKPQGSTSRDVVNLVQRMVRPHKVGHAGTLDPLATGVLVLTIGPATRLTEFIQRMPKSYLATFQFGQTSDTDDIEGEVVPVPQAPRISRDDVDAVLPDFVGTIQQRPPDYSAVKVKGKRAYSLARSGERLQLKSRPVRIDSLEIVSFDYPQLEMRIRCGSGTYIRSLGRDIGRQLGTGAVMSALVRTAIGHLTIDTAVAPSNLSQENIGDHLLSAREAITQLPQTRVSVDEFRSLANGGMIDRPSIDVPHLAALTDEEQLVAILGRRHPGRYGPIRNFANQL